jgi:hypothetical protein
MSEIFNQPLDFADFLIDLSTCGARSKTMNESNRNQGQRADYVEPKVEVIPGNQIRGGLDNRVDFTDEPSDDPSGYSTS